MKRGKRKISKRVATLGTLSPKGLDKIIGRCWDKAWKETFKNKKPAYGQFRTKLHYLPDDTTL